MANIVNIAAYKFVTLDDLQRRRRQLLDVCKRLDTKGTILLSEEGINLFLAGSRESIDELTQTLRSDERLSDLEVKESLSDDQPFNRMLVKIKKEIIAFAVDGIDPRRQSSRRISSSELKQWLDEGRPVTLLDVRNQFEYEVGTFKDALSVGIDDFRSFPKAINSLPAELKQQPVVTFCTGGIRCEKAAPYLEQEGFAEVYQLDGGILKYFEQCGGAHYDGECFVFDKRVALDESLRETDTSMCFACQSILTAEDCSSPEYEYGKSCPYCYKNSEERLSVTLESRHEALRRATTPLPGSVPYENRRPIRVPERLDDYTAIDFVTEITSRLSRAEWLRVLDNQQLELDGRPIAPTDKVAAGQRLIHVMPRSTEPDVNVDISIIFEDEELVVFNKPSSLPMHPCGRFNRNTLTYILKKVYHPTSLRAAHRLDANTSGVVVFGKTRRVTAELQQQFADNSVEKTYIARVLGRPPSEQFESNAPIGRKPQKSGARTIDPEGLQSLTKFRAIRELPDGTTLIEARPLTGRTNQIRIHLWDMGLSICGDPLYLPDRQIGIQQTLAPIDPPLCLCASKLQLRHPTSGKQMAFEAPVPAYLRINSSRIAVSRSLGR